MAWRRLAASGSLCFYWNISVIWLISLVLVLYPPRHSHTVRIIFAQIWLYNFLASLLLLTPIFSWMNSKFLCLKTYFSFWKFYFFFKPSLYTFYSPATVKAVNGYLPFLSSMLLPLCVPSFLLSYFFLTELYMDIKSEAQFLIWRQLLSSLLIILVLILIFK